MHDNPNSLYTDLLCLVTFAKILDSSCLGKGFTCQSHKFVKVGEGDEKVCKYVLIDVFS